jgi:hypothetical protein
MATEHAIDGQEMVWDVREGKLEQYFLPTTIPPEPSFMTVHGEPIISTVDLQLPPGHNFLRLFRQQLSDNAPREVPPISGKAYARLNRSSRAVECRPPHPSSQKVQYKPHPAPQKKLPLSHPRESPPDELQTERRLSKLAKAQSKNIQAWPETKPQKRKAPSQYEGLKPRQRPVHAPMHVIDPHEPASVTLRNQAIRQSIVTREAAARERERDEKEWDDRVLQLNRQLTPYLRSLDELEAPRRLSREQIEQSNQADRVRQEELRAMLEDVAAIPSLVGHTAVLCDFISAENRTAKSAEMERVREEAAKRGKRAAANDALYREWAGSG